LIQVSLELSSGDSPGLLELQASGHGLKAQDGFSLSCASLTVLLRSFAAFLEGHSQWVNVLKAEKPGHFHFVAQRKAVENQRYRGASDLILQGIAGIERDFPEEIHVEIRGENHGT